MPEISESRYVVTAGWDDVPHLTEKAKRELLAGIPPYLRKARSKGIPSLGAGAIYPVDLEDVICEPFVIPNHYKRAYGFDVGWKRTAALWGAWDPEDGVCYLYAEHYMAEQLPSVHTNAIKARGDWVPGLIDPASRGRGQKDGAQLFWDYKELGLKLNIAENAVQAGLDYCWQLLASGRIKIFPNLGYFMEEYRIYRRDEKGKVVKEFDHLMDCMRYLLVSGRTLAKVKPLAIRTGGGHVPLDERVGY